MRNNRFNDTGGNMATKGDDTKIGVVIPIDVAGNNATTNLHHLQALAAIV